LNKIICGDALTELRKLPDELVQCVVTSPPYWSLRDYGTAKWEGGDPLCNHIEKRGTTRGGQKSTITGGQDITPHLGQYRNICQKCGAVRIDKQLGLEKTPEEYVSKMVEIFREVKRVLGNDGSVWLNLGDSYAGSGGAHAEHHKNPGISKSHDRRGVPHWGNRNDPGRYLAPAGLKPKDLVGIPWRVAFALQADGWYLRSDIIWSKPNPMPESVTDRPTKAHEYIFLLSKNAKYYYDAESIKEGAVWDVDGTGTIKRKERQREGLKSNPDDIKNGIRKIYPDAKTGYAFKKIDGTRNKRSVWEVATQPYPEAHYATFPEALIKPCILAGCPEGGIVLDPFIGSGTTAKVARDLNRQYYGIELNPEYIPIINRRLAQQRAAI